MRFDTASFAAFLILALLIDRGVPTRFRGPVLTALSWTFYSAFSIPLTGLLILSTTIDYLAARTMETWPRARRPALLASITTNLGLLAMFKYGPWILSLVGTPGTQYMTNITNDLEASGLILPMGISFYTFQSLGYTLDVHRGRCPVERDFWTFAAYVSFFPQLVAGPIERAGDLIPQIRRARVALDRPFLPALSLIVWGLFQKRVIADNLAGLVDPVFDPSRTMAVDAATLGIALYAFAFQIYADFAGYTNMARGIARLFRVDLTVNFDRPYLADSFRDFWHRWHITLSTWFRDNLYIPLGGRRGPQARQNINLLVTMTLAGLWHGASTTFLLWGLYHGILLAVERAGSRSGLPRLPRGLRVALTFHGVLVGWFLFRAGNGPDLIHLMGRIDGLGDPGSLGASLAALGGLVLPVLLADLWPSSRPRGEAPDHGLPGPGRALFLVLMWFLLTLLAPDTDRAFLYFQF